MFSLQRVREWLALALIVLLPFHALAVTVITKLIAGSGHAPLFSIAVWKESVLAVILLIAFLEIFLAIRDQRSGVRKWDIVDSLILSLIIVAFLISDFRSQITTFALGAKYDFVPLIAFFVLRRVPWSDHCRTLAVNGILCVASIVSLYGIATLFLPDAFFTWLGYSDLHSLYVPNGPLAAFQQIGGVAIHRVQATFSGPNQLGIWLLIPIAIAVSAEQLVLSKHHRRFAYTVLGLSLIALFLTFSRAAWIGAFVIIVIALFPLVKAHLTRARLLTSVFVLIALVFTALALFPQTLLRVSSTRGHIERPMEAVQTMIAHPFGLGLGSAGPATNRSSDPCVMLQPEDNPAWARAHPDLCVFLGDVQVQPTDRTCDCPFVPENWYLQIGVELGFLGFILYVLLIVSVMMRLQVTGYRLQGILLMFLGVSIAALFLHAWEDAAVAYTVWVFVAYALRYGNQSAKSSSGCAGHCGSVG